MNFILKILSKLLYTIFFRLLRWSVPLLPAIAALLFFKKKYLIYYKDSVRRMHVHVAAISNGPIEHFFEITLRSTKSIYEPIEGYCSQCGKCCLDQQCFFLEKADNQTFLCGIYDSPLRRISNCGSFPINGHDVERYQCPTYKVIHAHPANELHGN